ncbi:PAS domain-containing sensor histidine kinase [Nisaea denitrificans]|uniref:PAS domain-containing sensor histidine kinase n=1 Tax=Nisaea denitrificans TaxID=390877 RepID=UPI00048D3312|nr:PAS domain-containing protein [Nisaea denitrificans]
MRINSLHYAILFGGMAATFLLNDTAVSAETATAPTTTTQPSSPAEAATDTVAANNSASSFPSATLIWCGALFVLLQGALITLLVFGHLRRRRLSQALKASEKRFQDFASISPDWFWELDAEHKLTYLSDRYEKVTGTPVAIQLGHSYLRFAALEWNSNRADVWKEHRETLKAHEPFRNFEYAALGADDKPCFRRISGTPIFENGVFKGYRGTGTDITEERDRQAQLLRTIYEADHANRAKSAFLANMSHELRTPLNAIIGFSEILTDQLFGKMQNDRYLEYAKDINDTGQHLLTVLNDLLDISRIEAGFLTLDENVIDVQRMMRSCVRMLNEKISAAALTLSLNLPEDLPALLGDETRLRQVVINLLTNAVKFTPAGGKISASVSIIDDGGLEITVEDTGVGISERDLERVMEPFQQAEQDLSRRYGGVGLGLSLARNLTEMHDGTIKLESEPGVGTLVRVHLPADRVRAYPAQEAENAPGQTETLTD